MTLKLELNFKLAILKLAICCDGTVSEKSKTSVVWGIMRHLVLKLNITPERLRYNA